MFLSVTDPDKPAGTGSRGGSVTVPGGTFYTRFRLMLTPGAMLIGTEPRWIAATSKLTVALRAQGSSLLREKKGGCSGRVVGSLARWPHQQSSCLCRRQGSTPIPCSKCWAMQRRRLVGAGFERDSGAPLRHRATKKTTSTAPVRPCLRL